MKWKEWMKNNKTLISFCIILYIIIFYWNYTNNSGNTLIHAPEETPYLRFMSDCQSKCNIINLNDPTTIKNFCCYSSDLNQNEIIELRGDNGPEICALAYTDCDISCSDYGFNNVEGCGLNG